MPNPRGRPKSPDACPTCGALPCYQRKPLPPRPAARQFVGSYSLPDGSRRDLYMHTPENARAALAALRRDPGLIRSLQADEYEDIPAELRRDMAQKASHE